MGVGQEGFKMLCTDRQEGNNKNYFNNLLLPENCLAGQLVEFVMHLCLSR